MANYYRNTIIVFFVQEAYNTNVWFSREFANIKQAKEFINTHKRGWTSYKIVRLN